MNKKVFLIIKILMAAALISLNTACQPVSDEAYISALRATSDAPPAAENSAAETTPVLTLSENREITEDVSSVAEIITSEPLPAVTTEIITEPAPADNQPLFTASSLINAPYGLCFNLTDGVMIYGKNIDEKIYPASITKLLTALVALRYVPEDFIFEVGNEIWQVKPGSSVASLKTGQRLNLNSALTALLMPSGNDAALTIAVNVARYKAENSEDMTFDELLSYFISLMNEYIKEIELENSHFANPDGYHHDNHFSTMRDLLKICIASANDSSVSSICSRSSVSLTLDSGEAVNWTHHLPLLGNEEWGVIGLKTGFTDESLYSFAALAEFDGKQYITIVSGCPTAEQRTEDTKKLLSLARDGYHEETITDYLEDDFE